MIMKKYFVGENYQSIKQAAKPQLNEGERLFGHWKITTATNDKLSENEALVAKQIHSGNIVKSNHLDLSKVEADGIILKSDSTDKIGIYTADCVPVVIMTDDAAIALHVSRKSIVSGLMDNVMSFIAPTDVNQVYIGPHICEYHFSFDEEDFMIRKFRHRFPAAIHFHKGLLYLSLKKALLHFFDEWKINKEKITFDGRCNYEMLDLPSYRQWKQSGEEGELGRILTIVERQT
jgi:copper oxidase (laccase) domain-containing protein